MYLWTIFLDLRTYRKQRQRDCYICWVWLYNQKPLSRNRSNTVLFLLFRIWQPKWRLTCLSTPTFPKSRTKEFVRFVAKRLHRVRSVFWPWGANYNHGRPEGRAKRGSCPIPLVSQNSMFFDFFNENSIF